MLRKMDGTFLEDMYPENSLDWCDFQDFSTDPGSSILGKES